MSRDAAIAAGCLVLSFVSALGALRCIADRLLPSATIYTAIALALAGVGVREVLAAV